MTLPSATGTFGTEHAAASGSRAATRPSRKPGGMRHLVKNWQLGRASAVALAGLGGLAVALVLFYAISTSLKPPSQALLTPISWFPHPVEWSTYSQVFELVDFGRYFLNSAFVGACVTLLNVITCSLAGYSLAKFRFPGRGLMFAVVMVTLMIPIEVIYVPLYDLVYHLHWVNNYAGLIVPAGTSAFGVFLMRQGIIGVPDEMIEAARLDGATELRVLFRVVMPVVRGSVAALALFTFMSNWDSFLWPLLVVQKNSLWTVPVGLDAMQGDYNTSFTVMMAAALLSMAPTLLLFLALQRRFVEGVTAFAGQR